MIHFALLQPSMSFLSLSSSSSSTNEKPVVTLWGCELNDTIRKCVVEVDDDLLEHLVYLKTVSLGEDADDKLHVVAVESKNMVSSLKPVSLVSLRHSVLPMTCLHGFEFMPPVTFILKSGTGPVYLHGEHLILEDVSDYEPTEEDVPPDEGEDDTDQGSPEEEEEQEQDQGEEEEEEEEMDTQEANEEEVEAETANEETEAGNAELEAEEATKQR
ncbi:nucleoplasmin-like [Sceloporus undulatus]|uniref:nucleoplasmin-like n=1 Tax=Sceloporus undulatus TaxID=8520 RepID=UPI001C4C6246|nr:nucleoplasmin-like [Sceloporus undulatus]